MLPPHARLFALPLVLFSFAIGCSNSSTSFSDGSGGDGGAGGSRSPGSADAAGSSSSGNAAGSSSGAAGSSGARGSNSSGGSGASGSGSGSGSSSGGSSGSNSGSGAGTSSGSSSGGSSSSGGTGSGSVDGGSSGGAMKADGGALWSPTNSAPIHFHWMIGGFSTADILPNQAGQVVYDIDGENSSAADVAAIHAAGAIAVCYVDVGTLEMGRSDFSQFPSSVVGPVVSGWPGENWLIVSAANQSIILPIMKARFTNWCLAKGFDAIEPDNIDGWTNISNISQADNLAYDTAIGQMAHALPLSIGLKNLATDVSGSTLSMFAGAFDWALQEQCYEYSDCSSYTQPGSFLPLGKAVFDVEYNTAPDCTQANMMHMNAQQTDLGLVGATASGYKYTPCIPDNQTTW